MPVSDSDIRNLVPQETIKRVSVGDSLYIVMEPARKGGENLSTDTSISLLVVVGSVFRSALVDMGKDLASGP